MVTYKTDRKNYFYHLIQLLRSILIISLPIISDLLFKTTFVKVTYYWFAAGFILLLIFEMASKQRLSEIRFDTDKSQIIFIYKTLFSSPQAKRIPFENARLEYAKSKSSWTWLWEPLTLYFLKYKIEVFKVNKSKDGFSVRTLDEVRNTVESLSLPIMEV